MVHVPLPKRARACPIPKQGPEPVRHPVCARLYAGQSERAERLGLRARRAQLVDGLAGRVLEIGAGNGLNFARYPDAVTELTAVEPEPYLRALAGRAAGHARLPVRVIDATAEALPFEDGAFDAAVASLVLCSVADPRVALAEVHRVLRPDGELRFLEHVISERRVAGALRVADATVWPRLSGGCHLGRDTRALIEAAGFSVERCEQFGFRVPPLDPPKRHLIGLARRDERSPT